MVVSNIFLILPLFGEDSRFDEHIFQLAWFNHQPDPNAGCLGCLPLTVSPGNNKTASIFGSFGTRDLGHFSASEMVAILGG